MYNFLFILCLSAGEWEIQRKRQHFYFPHLQLPVFTLNKCKPVSKKLLSGWATWEDTVSEGRKCWICSTLDHMIKSTPQRWLLHHRGCLTQRQHVCCSGLWPVSERGVLLQAQPQEGTQDLGNGKESGKHQAGYYHSTGHSVDSYTHAERSTEEDGSTWGSHEGMLMILRGYSYWGFTLKSSVNGCNAGHCGCSYCWMPVIRGVMPIQSEGACGVDFWAKWILKAASKRQKNSKVIFVIFDTITLYGSWLESSVHPIIGC